MGILISQYVRNILVKWFGIGINLYDVYSWLLPLTLASSQGHGFWFDQKLWPRDQASKC